MRIQSDGRYEYRKDLYDETAEKLGENTRSKGLDAACEFTQRMLRNLERAVEHEDMTPKLAEELSTPRVNVIYCVEAGIEVVD